MEHERDMPNAAQPDAPNIARVAYDKYLASWGDEPSIAPHLRTSPGYTTGRVLIDMHNAADALDAAQAEIAKLRKRVEAADAMDEALEASYSFIFDEYYQSNRDDGHGLLPESRPIVDAITFALIAYRTTEAKP